ncbi:ATP-binding cassette domain-containing protein [Candidatus Contubernalis alkaliaceticus]|uniref:ATP-binding cassette domain-containing protein n=1 Tax=Candidatus Contubernalis alkaliaceticus TaxID=338645 RepID=UPI001F4C3BB5|nr:ATP-binding cassette domain-containing protein [Candidatus Contubernalis alkalaceticus]
MSKEISISVQNVIKTYGGSIRALDKLNFYVSTGSVFRLVGPNGAGKSTAVKIMTTLTKADSGIVTIAGHDILQNPNEIRKRIGCVFQKSGAFLDGTGRENLTLQGEIYGLRGQGLKKKVTELLDFFKLIDAADRHVAGYSGGMMRKLDIAMGLIHSPSILFLDEPTTGLDPESRSELWKTIAFLSNEKKVTILLTTHYLEEVDHLADRLAIINKGKIVVEGVPDALKRELKGDIIQISLSEANTNLPSLETSLLNLNGVNQADLCNDNIRLRVYDGSKVLVEVLQLLYAVNTHVLSATVIPPSLDEVYLKHTGEHYKINQISQMNS